MPSLFFLLCPQRKISLLGSTGSIGTQTLDIVTERSDIYEVTALAAGREGGREGWGGQMGEEDYCLDRGRRERERERESEGEREGGREGRSEANKREKRN